MHLGSCINVGGGMSHDTDARIIKTRAAYANLAHLWRLRDVSFAVKGRIRNSPMRAVSLYARET